MSDPEDFLTRWSRRKRQATEEPVTSPDGGQQQKRISDEPPAKLVEKHAALPPADAAQAPMPEPAFDLSRLPSIESISAETDIRVFLAPSVPAELRLAALRRAWVADPKVRDFVGLADYDFDFHTPGAIPGFGPLEMTEEMRREVVRIVSAFQQEPETSGKATAEEPDTGVVSGMPAGQPTTAATEINAVPSPVQPVVAAESDAATDQPPPHQDELIADKEEEQRREEPAALQQEHSSPENLQTLARRGHGRALPK
jgi:hypothetical protein